MSSTIQTIINKYDVTPAEAFQIHDILIEWCDVDFSEDSEWKINSAITEAYRMWIEGVDNYFNRLRAEMKTS